MQDPTFGVRLQPPVSNPDRLTDDDDHRRRDDALAWLDARQIRAGQPPHVAQPARPHADAVDASALIAPPMYSKDVSLLPGGRARSPRSVSTPTRWGRHPGLGGPRVHALGTEPLARNPGPYGPLFLWIDVASRTDRREHRRCGVVSPRGRGGCRTIVWSLPGWRAAAGRRSEKRALAGPPIRFSWMHLVAGIHNEALMLGLMLTGTEFALRGISATVRAVPTAGKPVRTLLPRPLHLPKDARSGRPGRRWACCWRVPR